ncbi:MAG: alpha/beta hydrolase family protein [Planctomycetaceae bacterium]
MTRLSLIVSCGLMLVMSHVAFTAEPLDLKAELSRPIITPQTSLEETQVYLERRIPRLPEVKTTQDWDALAAKWRKDVLDKVVFRGEAAQWRDHPLTVETLDEVIRGPGYTVTKLRYEILPGMWIAALLYEPESLGTTKSTAKVPVVLNVNGHDGKGKAADYKQIRCINLVKRGMIVLNTEWFGMGQFKQEGFSHTKMNQLDLCGSSGIAPFYLAMSKGLDLLLKHANADPYRVAVSGLSGGGWQTIFISGLDPRVTLANPVAGYSSYLTRARFGSDLGDSEQTPCDLGKYVDYIHLTAMRAPRATLLTFNAHDNCCFAAGHALPPLLAGCRPVYALFGEADRLVSHVNHVPGDHNFGQDNREAFYRAVGAFFYDGAKDFDAHEIVCDKDEIKKLDELLVTVPESNVTFTSLAKSLASKLPRADDAPADKAAKPEWQARRRKLLAQIVAAKDFDLDVEEVPSAEAGDAIAGATKIQRSRWRLSNTWTIPVVELTRGESKGTTVVVADAGRAAVADDIEKLLAEGQRVLAVDPLFFGESKFASRDWLWGLMLDTVGDRPLGVQASQLVAIARHAHDTDRGGRTVTLYSVGPRASLITLVAAALEPQAVGQVTQRDAMVSLKQHVIEQNRGVNEAAELFCFGLLEHFDVPQLHALIAPRRVEAK